jgi:hypothetical protein
VGVFTFPYHGLTKVISGGQHGADLGGLLAAFAMGIYTGGTAPTGWQTCRGPNPRLAALGLIAGGTYAERTKVNVLASDATLLFATDRTSPGTKLTLQLLREHNRPHVVIGDGFNWTETFMQSAYDLIVDNRVRVLNVAGNRDYEKNYHNQSAYVFMLELLRRLDRNNLLVRPL